MARLGTHRSGERGPYTYVLSEVNCAAAEEWFKTPSRSFDEERDRNE